MDMTGRCTRIDSMHRAWLIGIALGVLGALGEPGVAAAEPPAARPAPAESGPTDAKPSGPARAATPSAPSGAKPAPKPAAERDDDLVDVAAVIRDAVIDVRYATADNFTGKELYPVARCKLRRAVAARLAKAAQALRTQDRRLVLWDCYRPKSIQRELWKRVPDPRYVADPKVGSKHGRGAAVDVALADKAGQPVALPTKFDDFSEAAHRVHALAGDAGAEARRLEQAMVGAGFKPLATEWWHFDAPDSANYALSDEPL
jgi:D-alanyl-D-alanine dipeptidase